MIVCVDGMGWCEYDGRVLPVPSGSALVIPPGVPHLYRADGTRPWTIWWLHAAGRDVDVLLQAIRGQAEIAVVEIGDLFRVTSSLEHVVDCLERDETLPSLLEAAGSAWSLLAQLAADSAHGGHRRHEPIRDAQLNLRENFSAPVSVPDLARLAGLSTSHFSALFRAATGGGVIEYVKTLRMARARELLATTSRSVAEIAALVGYGDAFYFSRQFRTINGCSPSQYRALASRESVDSAP